VNARAIVWRYPFKLKTSQIPLCCPLKVMKILSIAPFSNNFILRAAVTLEAIQYHQLETSWLTQNGQVAAMPIARKLSITSTSLTLPTTVNSTL